MTMTTQEETIPRIERQLVFSSNIYSLGWKEERLHVIFRSDTNVEYIYHNVPPEVYEELLSSFSIGKAFHRLILKKETYPWEKKELD